MMDRPASSHSALAGRNPLCCANKMERKKPQKSRRTKETRQNVYGRLCGQPRAAGFVTFHNVHLRLFSWAATKPLSHPTKGLSSSFEMSRISFR